MAAGTTIEIDEEYPDGTAHGYVDNDLLIPDFSSFNKDDGLDAINVIAQASVEAQNLARKAGKGLFAAVKFAKGSIDAAVEKAESNTENCYEIMPYDREDTEDIMQVVEQLKADHYATYVGIYKGDMRGYVFLKEKDVKTVEKYLEVSDGRILTLRKTDKHTAEIIKNLMK